MATKKQNTTATVSFPEVGTLESAKELKKLYKGMTDTQLDEWLALEGLTDKVKISGHGPIDRMRKCMAISALHFPPAPKAPKSKSKYADYTTEQLVQMAMDHDIPVKDDKGDVRILRMYTIMALREAGVLA